jgi:hypothetical protein
VVGDSKCENNQIWLCNKSQKWDKTDDCAELSTLNAMTLVCFPPGPDGPAACLPPLDSIVDAGDTVEDAADGDTGAE